jgi:hypothetical protein
LLKEAEEPYRALPVCVALQLPAAWGRRSGPISICIDATFGKDSLAGQGGSSSGDALQHTEDGKRLGLAEVVPQRPHSAGEACRPMLDTVKYLSNWERIPHRDAYSAVNDGVPQRPPPARWPRPGQSS